MPRIWYSSYMNITDIWFLSTIKEFERQGIVFLVIFFLFLINIIKFLIKAALEEKSKLIEEFGLLPYLLTYEPNFNLEFLRVILFMILLINLCQMLLWKDFWITVKCLVIHIILRLFVRTARTLYSLVLNAKPHISGILVIGRHL